jgi:polyhydroxyalkanoate synthesis regulator phasin
LLQIKFPKEKLEQDDFVIQVFPTSALSKNPAERKQDVIDLMQGGLIDPQEGRRLLDYPDLQQHEDLVNATEERILKVLDEMVEDGKYTPPDPSMDLQKAKVLVLQYINKYVPEQLPEKKRQLLDTFNVQIEELNQLAQQQMQWQMQQQAAQQAQLSQIANPQAPPIPMQPSPMVNNTGAAA